MSEPLSEFLAVRCTASMKESLDSIASKGINRNVADHVRFAVEMYIDNGLSAVEGNEVDRVKSEMEKAFGMNVNSGEMIAKLITHWDLTKRDSYGYSTFQ